VTVLELIGVVLGSLLCGLPSLIYGATHPPLAVTALVLAIAAMGLALFRPGARWQTGAGIGFGLLLVVGLRIVVDSIRDPTSHNLWPFEVVSALVVGVPPAALGVLLGRSVRHVTPRPTAAGIVLVASAIAVAMVSAMTTASEIATLEAFASKKVAALVAAERAFRDAHPLRGYTCNLAELDELFSGPIQNNHRSESYRLGQVVYRGGTSAIENRYRYSLKCEGRPDPQASFVLTARSLVELGDTRPLEIFCAGADGAIRSISSGRLYACFTEGRLVGSVD